MAFGTIDSSIVGTQYCFTAFLSNVKILFSVLKVINFQENCTFCATEHGLKVTVEQGKCVQASAYIPSENFSEYHVAPGEPVEFRLNLNVLTSCLNIFGATEEASLKIYYKVKGAPLILVLKQLNAEDVMMDCEIKTQISDELMYFRSEDDSADVGALVVKGPQLLAALGDLERASEVLEVRLSPDHPHLTIITIGSQDKSVVEIPKSSDMMYSFECSEEVNLRYKAAHIRLLMKGLALATKVAIKMDSRGLLTVQQMIEREEQQQSFIEYYITPLLAEDD